MYIQRAKGKDIKAEFGIMTPQQQYIEECNSVSDANDDSSDIDDYITPEDSEDEDKEMKIMNLKYTRDIDLTNNFVEPVGFQEIIDSNEKKRKSVKKKAITTTKNNTIKSKSTFDKKPGVSKSTVNSKK